MKTYKVKITEKFIKEAHAVACDEWKTKIKNLVPDAFELEAGKWYKHNDRVFFITDFDCNGHAYGYGIDEKDNWLNAKVTTLDLCILNKWLVKDIIPATEKEVEEMLTKEAKRRGLVEDVEVKSFLSGYKHKITGNYELVDNNLYVDTIWGNVCIFKDGEWAEPIKHKNLRKIEVLRNELEKLKSEL